MEQSLPEAQAKEAERHVRLCPQCASDLAMVRKIVTAARALPHLLPPADLRQRVLAQLAREQKAQPTWAGKWKMENGKWILSFLFSILHSPFSKKLAFGMGLTTVCLAALFLAVGKPRSYLTTTASTPSPQTEADGNASAMKSPAPSKPLLAEGGTVSEPLSSPPAAPPSSPSAPDEARSGAMGGTTSGAEAFPPQSSGGTITTDSRAFTGPRVGTPGTLVVPPNAPPSGRVQPRRQRSLAPPPYSFSPPGAMPPIRRGNSEVTTESRNSIKPPTAGGRPEDKGGGKSTLMAQAPSDGLGGLGGGGFGGAPPPAMPKPPTAASLSAPAAQGKAALAGPLERRGTAGLSGEDVMTNIDARMRARSGGNNPPVPIQPDPLFGGKKPSLSAPEALALSPQHEKQDDLSALKVPSSLLTRVGRVTTIPLTLRSEASANRPALVVTASPGVLVLGNLQSRNTYQVNVGSLRAGQAKDFPLVVIPRQPGTYNVTISLQVSEKDVVQKTVTLQVVR